MPKIGGSSAGFIALIVVLSTFIFVACVGIFVLLRSHREDPFERHARRVLSGERSQTMYEMPLGPKGMREKFKMLFTFNKMKREGWVRANSADEDPWDASEYPAAQNLRATQTRENNDKRWTPDTHDNTLNRSETSESIQLSAHRHQDSLQTLVTDFADSPKKSHIDSFSASPTSIASHEGIPNFESLPDRNSQRSDRNASSHFFTNGTRFKESLDF
jgi:hypothetical protein